MLNKKYDVIVAGGGTAGMIAAIAAARNGAKTLVIEKCGHLGGTATFGVPFLGIFCGQGTQVNMGLIQELVDRLIAAKGSAGHARGGQWATLADQELHDFSLTPFEPEILKYVAQEMVLEAGAEILFHTVITDVIKEGDTVKGVEIFNVSGKCSFYADVVIDATGDANIAAFAGVPFQDKDKKQNASILFRVCNVDLDKFKGALEKGENVKGWGEWHTRIVKSVKVLGSSDTYTHIAGHLTPWEDKSREVTFTAVSAHEGEIFLNATRITGIDPTNAEDLTRAEIMERRNVVSVVEAMRAAVPGFEKAYVAHSSPVGIRESRNIIGDYMMTEQDVVDARNFPDGIARGSYPIDIHDPSGGRTQFTFIKNGQSYNIPYRSLLPLGVEGLLVAGRPISANHKAMGSTRIMGCVMSQGQAAGTAAALAVKAGVSPRQLDVETLKTVLLSQGANI
ncbi:MAG: FAD-dependent oxidoreductase [Negativicutes bacterium]